jgi:exopolyphosphatase/guanosine-5'-triphosphate,3'-diphosphate pyrophosphatase
VADVVAAVDVGTQSTRLLVSDGEADLARVATVTHLGKGVVASGQLDPERVEATLEVLREFRALADRHGASRSRAITTAVVRNSANPDAFLSAAEDILGVALETVSGEEEGRLAFAGATAKLPADLAPFVTVDLGGGSTEFAVGSEACEAVISAPFGATMLTERYLPSDPPRPEELVAALSIAEAHLDDVARTVPAIPAAKTFLGLGGTFTTIAAVEIGLPTYDRAVVNGFHLQRAAAEDVYRTLVTERHAHRIQNPGLPAERGHTIVGGACAVVEIMRYFGLDAVVISDDDLLDGLVSDLLASR